MIRFLTHLCESWALCHKMAAKSDVGKKVRVFLDIDIGGWRAAYQRACDFVEATNMRYSLSSNVLEELGGSEKSRIRKELYPNDFE